MKDSQADGALSRTKRGSQPSLHIVCLGSGGGPTEDNVTGFLVRSIKSNWSKGSVLAVDAGSHLAAISRLLTSDFPLISEPKSPPRSGTSLHRRESIQANDHAYPQDTGSSESSRATTPEPETRVLTSGPFAGVEFPFASARANALYVVRECISTYLITHPHLDHLSGFALNTAAFHNTSRPKKLAALSSTVNAIKTHIFNDIIWPNLTDEDGGVGFVTFQRLAQGGNIAVGEGQGKGYIEVCDSLCVKGMKISHGRCTYTPGTSLLHRGSDIGLSEPTVPHNANAHSAVSEHSSPTKLRRTSSFPQQAFANQGSGTPTVPSQTAASPHTNHNADPGYHEHAAVVDSTAYFIRDDATGREILFFGDVEPDSLSLHPRTAAVWSEAAPKVANGTLRAVLIECSYDDSQADAILFGHLAPRHLVKELQVLADAVKAKRHDRHGSKKRKRMLSASASGSASYFAGVFAPADPTSDANTDISAPATDDEHHHHTHHDGKRKSAKFALATSPSELHGQWLEQQGFKSPVEEVVSSASAHPPPVPHAPSSGALAAQLAPLAGVTVIVIHVKDTLRDGPLVGETILRQLKEHEAHLKELDGVGLGCEFVISKAGDSFYF